MAEKTILVCDVCGKPATQAVSIRVGQRNLWKDLCDLHVAELSAGARPAKPGRRRGATASAGVKRSTRRARKKAAAGTVRARSTQPRKAKATAAA
jgi:hypothetical protein